MNGQTSTDVNSIPGAGRRRTPERRWLSARAQSFTELALILPIMILMLAITVDLGRAFTAYIAITSSAREGAAFGMQSAEAAADTNGMRAATLADSPMIWGVQPQVSFPPCTDGAPTPFGTSYQCVAVRVNYQFQPLIAIWPIPNQIPMERTVRMRVIN